MTPDQRQMWTWIGSGVAVLGIGWGVLLWRGSVAGESATAADDLYGKYLKLYHPDKPGGFAVEQAQSELRKSTSDQAEELRITEGALAPPLAEAYTRGDLSDANAQVQADLESLRQLSARTKIAIPVALPFQGGLDADAKMRARQLAQLYLARLSTQTALQAGVARVSAVAPGEAYASPDLGYAVFTCSLDVDAPWDATARLCAAFATSDGRGLGLRSLDIQAAAPDQPQKVRLVATLTAPNREAWGLAPGQAGTAGGTTAGAAAGQTAAPAAGVRRLGGARP